MVRPIEITDSLSKTEALQRLQQNQKVLPEAAQQFQKSLSDKLTQQVTTPNPVAKSDQVVLHVDEQEEEKRKTAEGEEQPADDKGEESFEQDKREDDESSSPHEHIDFKA